VLALLRRWRDQEEGASSAMPRLELRA